MAVDALQDGLLGLQRLGLRLCLRRHGCDNPTVSTTKDLRAQEAPRGAVGGTPTGRAPPRGPPPPHLPSAPLSPQAQASRCRPLPPPPRARCPTPHRGPPEPRKPPGPSPGHSLDPSRSRSHRPGAARPSRPPALTLLLRLGRHLGPPEAERGLPPRAARAYSPKSREISSPPSRREACWEA